MLVRHVQPRADVSKGKWRGQFPPAGAACTGVSARPVRSAAIVFAPRTDRPSGDTAISPG